MAVASKEDLGQLYELVGTLSPEEIALLREFPPKDTVSPLLLASRSYLLPRLVRASLAHLAGLGLVEILKINEDKKNADPASDAERAKLTPQGHEAQTIAQLMNRKSAGT